MLTRWFRNETRRALTPDKPVCIFFSLLDEDSLKACQRSSGTICQTFYPISARAISSHAACLQENCSSDRLKGNLGARFAGQNTPKSLWEGEWGQQCHAKSPALWEIFCSFAERTRGEVMLTGEVTASGIYRLRHWEEKPV